MKAVAVLFDTDAETVRAFAASRSAVIKVLWDPERVSEKHVFIPVIPVTLVVDSTGRVVAYVPGTTTDSGAWLDLRRQFLANGGAFSPNP